MIDRLIVLGASGDLAGRFLFPAMAALADAEELPDELEIIGAAQSNWDDEEFREITAERLERHAPDAPAAAREQVLGRLRYQRVDVTDAASVAAVVSDPQKPAAVYLALPPSVFSAAVTALARVGLAAGSRLALEKPFGESLESAVALNAHLAESLDQEQIFRVDHALGMATTENLLGLRFANRILEPLWSSAHVAEVELLWEETLALEGRAGYYDYAGALKDVVQNHLLQLLAIVAMEPGPEPRRDLKTGVLRAVRSINPEHTRRARYTSGHLSDEGEGEGREVAAYVDEEGVDAGRKTETYAEIEIEIDNSRWQGTRFVLRGGKALARRRKEIVVRFKPSRHPPYGQELGGRAPNTLRIGVDGPTDISLQLQGSFSGPPPQVDALELAAPPITSKLPPYGRVLRELLTGGSELAVGAEEAELAWSIVTPVLEAWGADLVPLEEYPAGSDGP